jgi:chromosomal replication initiator protein
VDQALNGLWDEVLNQLQAQLSRPTFETWIKPTQAQSLDEETLVISTPNPFARNWVQKHYVSTITNVVQAILGQPVMVQVTVVQAGDNQTDPCIPTRDELAQSILAAAPR